MWSTKFTRSSSATDRAIWLELADVAGWTTWNEGVAAIEVLDTPAAGARFLMTPADPPDATPLLSTITEFDPPYRFTDVTEVDGIVVRVEKTLRASEGATAGSEAVGVEGATTISYRISVEGEAPDAVLSEIGSQVSADFPEVMAALARRAERSGA